MVEIDETRKKEIQEEEKLRAEARANAEDELKEKKKKEENKAAGQGCGCLIILIIIIFVFIFISLSGDSGEKPTLSKAEQRVERIEKQFSAWDGSHLELTRAIKESMNDPKSYEHVETRYSDMGDYVVVSTTFRGKNAFGGTVVNIVNAKVSLDGKIIDILDWF